MGDEMIAMLLLAARVTERIVAGDRAGAIDAARKLAELGVEQVPAQPQDLTDAGAKVAEDVADTAEALKVGG